jgi:hypothetical protein
MPTLDPGSVLVGLMAGGVLGYVYAHAEHLVAHMWRTVAVRILGPDVYR